MNRHTPLPTELAAGPFSVRAASRLGVGKGRLAGGDLARPFSGVRSATAHIQTIEALCQAYAQRMPAHHFFSHTTAARLWHVPLPTRFEPGEAVHVCSTTRDRIRCDGAIGHQPRDRFVAARRLGAFRVADPETTWCHLATLLRLDDLVAAGDAFVFRPRYPDKDAPAPQPYSSVEKLARRLRTYRGAGKTKAAAALSLVREGCASPRETQLRLLLTRAGLPEPTLNVDILDSQGNFVACGDLYYPRWRVLVEYDGDQHRTNTEVYENDMVRSERIRKAGVTYIRVRKAGLAEKRMQTIHSTTAALTAAGWRRP